MAVVVPARRLAVKLGVAMRVLGFMSGTSLDAVDMAVLETDGDAVSAYGPGGERKLSSQTRAVVMQATREAQKWPRGAPRPAVFDEAARAVAQEHLEAALEFLAANGVAARDLDLVGFHGQTVLHERPNADRIGRTVQLGDAALLAHGLGVPVAHDFRTADVAAGGEGAPLAPIYHAALARMAGLPAPIAVLNLGGVANITLIGSDGQMLAYDTGPANGMIDLWVQAKTDRRYDADGRLAAAGRADPQALARLLDHPYFAAPGPKSLDRYDFPLTPVEGLSLEDGAATLTAFTAETVALAVRAAEAAPSVLIACGGGRRNPTLMSEIRARAGVPVKSAEDVGWRGDSIEAEAFAYLAARTARGLPISFPGTTGVEAPMTGGVIVEP
ncbi:MAG TPA: anhydro-N-acetylmuramic acid kinase [Caulobacteraceae bacterium]|jgi:anhydro-N-acetylmuramic acid kinase|nr:anhydro-N-acetylmuramic acid kinase [Caulobacteraceae bacterium]